MESLQESIKGLEELKNEYQMQVELLQKSSSRPADFEATVAKLESDKRDLLGALAEETRKRNELEEMCVKLDRARRALKDQIQFIRDENERVLDSVKKQIKHDLGSSMQTPLHSQSMPSTPQPNDVEVNNEDEEQIKQLIAQAKDDLRQAAAISSPGQHLAAGVNDLSW